MTEEETEIYNLSDARAGKLARRLVVNAQALADDCGERIELRTADGYLIHVTDPQDYQPGALDLDDAGDYSHGDDDCSHSD
jgi:hypothetical protein